MNSRKDSSRSRALSRRLAAALHKCVGTTENVALPCLGVWRKGQRALKAMMPPPLIRFALGGTLHAGRDGASFERVLVEQIDQSAVMASVKHFVEDALLVPVILRFLHHHDVVRPGSCQKDVRFCGDLHSTRTRTTDLDLTRDSLVAKCPECGPRRKRGRSRASIRASIEPLSQDDRYVRNPGQRWHGAAVVRCGCPPSPGPTSSAIVSHDMAIV